MNGNTKWIMGIFVVLIGIASSVAGYAIARVDSIQQSLTTEYVQKADYRCDMADLKASLNTLNKKMDDMLKK